MVDLQTREGLAGKRSFKVGKAAADRRDRHAVQFLGAQEAVRDQSEQCAIERLEHRPVAELAGHGQRHRQHHEPPAGAQLAPAPAQEGSPILCRLAGVARGGVGSRL